MSEQFLALLGGAGTCLFILALYFHTSLGDSMPDPTPDPLPPPTPAPAPSGLDQVDQALADLRTSQETLLASIGTQASTSKALAQAQQADVQARASMTTAALDRDQKRAAVEALIDHLFSSTPPFA